LPEEEQHLTFNLLTKIFSMIIRVVKKNPYDNNSNSVEREIVTLMHFSPQLHNYSILHTRKVQLFSQHTEEKILSVPIHEPVGCL